MGRVDGINKGLHEVNNPNAGRVWYVRGSDDPNTSCMMGTCYHSECIRHREERRLAMYTPVLSVYNNEVEPKKTKRVLDMLGLKRKVNGTCRKTDVVTKHEYNIGNTGKSVSFDTNAKEIRIKNILSSVSLTIPEMETIVDFLNKYSDKD